VRHDSAAAKAEPDDITAGDALPPAGRGRAGGDALPPAGRGRAGRAALPPAGRGRAGKGRRARWPFALVLAWAALAAADLAVSHSAIFRSGPGSRPGAEAAVTAGAAAHSRARGTPTPHEGSARAGGSRRPTAEARVLAPVSASVIGPAGSGSGDNPQVASRAIDPSTTTAWVTHWYRTARFGGLQTGTGLLIDMGRPVRISRVAIILGDAPGADLELLTAKLPALTGQRLQATASDAGGSVQLKLARPGRARYLVVWFTLLPQDTSGTFQASVYNVQIVGRP